MAYGSKFCSKIENFGICTSMHVHHLCPCTSFVPMGIVTLINSITVCGRVLYCYCFKYCLLLHILIISLSGGTVDLNTLM